jgi:peptide deformylase
MGNPILRRTAQAFTKEEITSSSTKELVNNMLATMRKADGIGLAAPQVGVAKQLVVIRKLTIIIYFKIIPNESGVIITMINYSHYWT